MVGIATQGEEEEEEEDQEVVLRLMDLMRPSPLVFLLTFYFQV
jgi:hypothetical protein